MLVERGLITELQLVHALSLHRLKRQPLGEVLLELGLISEDELARTLAKPAPTPAQGATALEEREAALAAREAAFAQRLRELVERERALEAREDTLRARMDASSADVA